MYINFVDFSSAYCGTNHLVMELGTMKDDFAAFREKPVADRESVEAEFDASGDTVQLWLWLLSFYAQHMRE